MKKIYTLTYNNAYNYGALLQAFALQTALNSLGGNVSVINQKLHKERFHNQISFSKSGIKEFFYCFRHLNRYMAFLKASHKMKRFHDTLLNLTPPIRKISDFQTFVSDADKYVVGSDQVWSSSFTNPPSFFSQFLLEWCPKHAQRFSYAASTGRSVIPKSLQEQFVVAVNKFEYVSVREESSRRFLKEELGIQARRDCDPVFLLNIDEWNRLLDKKKLIQEPYILCFELTSTDYYSKLVEQLCRNKKYKIVLVSRNYYSSLRGQINYNSAGPLEFLQLIRDAEYVITTSFHGTAFSLLFEKQFYACLSSNPPERIIDLLSLVGAEDRIINSRNYETINFDQTLDYSIPRMKLKRWREDSLSYIDIIVNGDKK